MGNAIAMIVQIVATKASSAEGSSISLILSEEMLMAVIFNNACFFVNMRMVGIFLFAFDSLFLWGYPSEIVSWDVSKSVGKRKIYEAF